MLIEQIIEFELKRSGHFGRTCTPKTGYFHYKQNLNSKFSNKCLFTAKNNARANVHCFFLPEQTTNKI